MILGRTSQVATTGVVEVVEEVRDSAIGARIGHRMDLNGQDASVEIGKDVGLGLAEGAYE